MNLLQRFVPVLALLCVTAIWGWTFVVVRDAVAHYPVLPFLALRFGLASLLLVPIVRSGGAGFKAGILPGVALAVGYLCQTFGLQYTTASRAGLLTGLFVVFTPLLEVLVTRRRIQTVTYACAFAALVGTLLLTEAWQGGNLGTRQTFGDGLEVLTAIAFSIHMLLLSRVGTTANASRVALSQMFVATGLFGAGSVALGGVPPVSGSVLFALVITAALASALAFWVQTAVQQRISPTRTSVVLVAEPAFAALFGIMLAGDRFTLVRAAGAFVILSALLANEISVFTGADRRPGDAIWQDPRGAENSAAPRRCGDI